MNQYDSAYHYLLEYERLSLDEKAHETGLQMEELKTKYETQRKEATILAQEKLLTQQKIIQWSVFRLCWSSSIAFFSIFS